MDAYLKTVEKEDFDCWWYARQVEAGHIPACQFVKNAIKRERDKMADPDCPYYFDPHEGFRFFAFCRHFYHLKGDKGGTPFILAAWQIWSFSMLLGWKNKEGQYKDKRQYKVAYFEVPRGSGKSAMMGLLGLYMLCMDNEWEPEVYVAATKKDQANLLFNSVVRQVEFPTNKKIIRHIKVKRKREYLMATTIKGGTFKSLSKDSKSFDGMNIHCALVDEIHAHPDSEIWDVLSSGSNKRAQSLMVGITTAGTNFSNFGFQQSTYMKKLIRGDFTDDETFACVWTIDKGDDIYDPDIWVKANPSWWTSAINHTKFANAIERTRNWSDTKAETFTKLLNIWYQSSDKWLDPEKVAACNTLMIPEETMKKDRVPCIIGVDLGWTEDMTALVNVYEKLIDEGEGNWRKHYYVYPRYFSPSRLIESGSKPKYTMWEKEGLLETIPGDTVDYQVLQEEIFKEYRSHRVIETAFDRWNGHQLMTNIQNQFGRDSVSQINQSMGGLNDASKFFKRLILEGRIHFHNDIFVWNCVNSVVRLSNDGAVLVSKDPGAPLDKIDGVKATLNALERFMVRNGNTGDSWEAIII
ncbi:terminase large subunit [Gluconobacter sp. LMG 1744]|uniref:terminase large subunit n=1 Tax=Gluconobacter cadivus TaxID=2728101 RepID=UPI0018849E55|nr:terminase large subunit [Gluconobacter cadivus]MBF0892721.1 terminase large subunit [Gluconobacter cadivus]